MLTRRELVKAGVVLGTRALVRPRWAFADDDGNLPASPPTTPFVKALPLPPPPIPTSFVSTDCGSIDAGARHYQLVEEERLVQFHPQLPPTAVWCYRDVNQPNATDPANRFAVGPTFMERMNQPVVVRFMNNLPANHIGFGDPRTTVHHHGGHQEARSDGFPTFFFGPGQSYDYCYPMFDRGFSHGTPDTSERTSTDWYHDHLIDFTGPNVYRGLVGFYLVFDNELDTGNEATGVRLPSTPFDIPLVVQDKRFNRNGQLVFNTFEHNGFLGDKFCVNGAIQPFLRVKRRRYRFRFLNGSNARIYQLYLVNGAGQTFTFDQVATDGGLLAQSIPNITNFQLAMAERVEVVIDFSLFPSTTTELYLENRLRQTEGQKPDGLASSGPRILKFILEEPVADASLPTRPARPLRPFAATTQAQINAAVRRTFVFNREDDAWSINERFFDPNRPLVTVGESRPQIWKLVNDSGDWWHPIHIHLDVMRVLTRNGRLPPLNERDGMAKKDTILLRGDDTVEVFLNFQDFRGPFVFHCHNLEHEDMAMMARFDVV